MRKGTTKMLTYKEALEYELEILAELLENSNDKTQTESIIEMMVALTKYLNKFEKRPNIC